MSLTAPYNTYEQERDAEDVQDQIYIISPVDNPVASMSRTIRATNTTHGWSEDVLQPANKNAKEEGDAAAFGATDPIVPLFNYTQIMDKTAQVTGTLEEIDKYGRDSEMAYQLELRYGELANDEEVAIMGKFDGVRQTAVIGGTGTAREMASLYEQLDAGNIIDGNTGVTTFTDLEEKILDAHLAAYNAGGTPSYMVTSPAGARHISNFMLSAGRNRDIRNERRLINVIDLYVSNYGELDVVMDRHMVDVNTITGAHTPLYDYYLLDFNYLATPVLRATRDWPIAKLGDSDQRQVLRESTYAVLNTKAHAIVENAPAVLTAT